MGKAQSSAINQGLGVNQVAGEPSAGSRVYYVLSEGVVRPATVIRAYQNEERNEIGTLLENVDLFVFALDEDELPNDPIVMKVAKTPVGVRSVGTWDWMEPRESGF